MIYRTWCYFVLYKVYTRSVFLITFVEFIEKTMCTDKLTCHS